MRDIIIAQNLSYSYETGDDSRTLAIDGLDLSIQRGSFTAILGHNGSGKSTLARQFNAVLLPSGGRVLVDGMETKNEALLLEIRRRIGIVPQKAVVLSGTIRDNLLWGDADASEETLLQAVQTAQAQDVVREKGGLDGRIEQGGRNLSGGQRQRLTIARALVRKPEILILDDSASALDFATDAALRRALRALPYHPTVFIVSQRTASIRFADRILVLDEGRAVGVGTHETLLETCPVYREIYDSQFRREGAV